MTIAFVFPGQGSQTIGMGRDFFDTFSSAREVFAEVDDALEMHLSKLIFEGSPEELTLTANAQPALMAVSMAIIQTLVKEKGAPLPSFISHVAGHSLGEYTAHCAAGTFSLKDTAKLLRQRGQAMQAAVPVGKGSMAAILGLDIAVVEKVSEMASEEEICVVANDNSPGQAVISGHKQAVEQAMTSALEHGAKRVLPLAVSAPFHSPLMQPAALVMADAIGTVDSNIPQIPIITNVTTQACQDLELCKSLLVQQVTGRVRWRESMMNTASLGITHVVEVGAGKVLTGLMKRIDDRIATSTINTPHDMDAFLKSI